MHMPCKRLLAPLPCARLAVGVHVPCFPAMCASESESFATSQVAFYLAMGKPIVQLLEDLMAELGLEDLRQV